MTIKKVGGEEFSLDELRKAVAATKGDASAIKIEAENGTDERFIDEASDLVYHLQVLLASRNFTLGDVAKNLETRHRKATATAEQIESFNIGEKQWGK